jgi:organic hydroperoxide reductase OsmC/OhrA
MGTVTVELRSTDGTEAAMGWAGAHTLVVDRPDGKAGGRGLGFNGAELLGLTIGGCFCNDLRYVAHGMGIALDGISVSVTVELAGDPVIATRASMRVACTTSDGSDPVAVIEQARTISMAANSLPRGIPVAVEVAPYRAEKPPSMTSEMPEIAEAPSPSR